MSGKNNLKRKGLSTENIRNMHFPPNSFIDGSRMMALQAEAKVQIIDAKMLSALQQAGQIQEFLPTEVQLINKPNVTVKKRTNVVDELSDIDDDRDWNGNESDDHEERDDGTDVKDDNGHRGPPELLAVPGGLLADEQGNEHGTPHNHAACCAECRDERRQEHQIILRRLHEILAQGDGGRRPQTETYPLLPPMPFNEVAALQLFDEDIKENEEMRKQFIAKLTAIGGKTVAKTVKFAMETVMTNQLAQQVVWTQGPEDKPKLIKFTFPGLVVQIVRAAFRDAKKIEIENTIAAWLRRGGDRIKAATAAAAKRHVREEQ